MDNPNEAQPLLNRRRFTNITESDARLSDDGAIVTLDAGGRISSRAAEILALKNVVVSRTGAEEEDKSASRQQQDGPVPIVRTKARSRTTAAAGIVALIIGVAIFASTQVTIFVVQPIGAVPEGRTLLISRLNASNFIDSADAMCERIQGSVNLLCRGMVLGKVGQTATIYARLPYSETLYLLSTRGNTYGR